MSKEMTDEQIRRMAEGAMGETLEVLEGLLAEAEKIVGPGAELKTMMIIAKEVYLENLKVWQDWHKQVWHSKDGMRSHTNQGKENTSG